MVIVSIAATHDATGSRHLQKRNYPADSQPLGGAPKLMTRAKEAMKCRRGILQILPTGFRNSRDHSLGSKFTKRDSGQTKTTDEPTSPAALLATIDETRRTGIPWKQGKTFVVVFRLQCSTNSGIFFHRLLFPLIPLNPRLLCHSKVGK
jgi:hypothetical protein